jgi:hypothetical protein
MIVTGKVHVKNFPDQITEELGDRGYQVYIKRVNLCVKPLSFLGTGLIEGAAEPKASIFNKSQFQLLVIAK